MNAPTRLYWLSTNCLEFFIVSFSEKILISSQSLEYYSTLLEFDIVIHLLISHLTDLFKYFLGI